MASQLPSCGVITATSPRRPTSNFTLTTPNHHLRRHLRRDQPPSPAPTLGNADVGRRNSVLVAGGRSPGQGFEGEEEEGEVGRRRLVEALLWGVEAVYIGWLVLLPYAPGDPVWAISSATINSILDLSVNFFFILPAVNLVGIHSWEAPVCHPVAEGLFNFVIGWTFLFAPLLFTDRKRSEYKGSLEVLWGMQMFLTNVFLIPYMAIRINDNESDRVNKPPSLLATTMTHGATIVAATGGLACLVSLFWGLFGRAGGDFGGVLERWEFLRSYIGSERLAYAFIWDIILYSIFQPWLIGDNLQNLKQNTVGTVNVVRFVPVLGLLAYLLSLDNDRKD